MIIPREKADAIRIKELDRGKWISDTLQRGKAQTKRIKRGEWGRIGDNTESNGRGSTNQGWTNGGSTATLQRGRAAAIQKQRKGQRQKVRGKVDAIRIKGGTEGGDDL